MLHGFPALQHGPPDPQDGAEEVQLPPTQFSEPQQSELLVHDEPLLTQHVVLQLPLQHWLPLLHLRRTGRQQAPKEGLEQSSLLQH